MAGRLKDEDKLVTRAQLQRVLEVTFRLHEGRHHVPWWTKLVRRVRAWARQRRLNREIAALHRATSNGKPVGVSLEDARRVTGGGL